MNKIKISKVILVKGLGLAMSIGGMIASNWAGNKERDQVLEKIVSEKLKNK